VPRGWVWRIPITAHLLCGLDSSLHSSQGRKRP
jgi:hypothetical protein